MDWRAILSRKFGVYCGDAASGGDRVLVRSTLEQARHEAHKLAALDDAAE